MIKQIEKAIQKMIEDTTISPNMIKMHPVDLLKLESIIPSYVNINTKIKKIFGLGIIEDLNLKEGTAIVYNDNFVIKLTETDESKTLKDLERKQGLDSFVCINPLEVRKEAINWIKEFQNLRTRAISGMFDNPDEYGIYPTTELNNCLDNFWKKKFNITKEDLLK